MDGDRVQYFTTVCTVLKVRHWAQIRGRLHSMGENQLKLPADTVCEITQLRRAVGTSLEL